MASTVPNNEATRFKTGEKQVEIARQGGIASGKAKREKATMLSTLKKLLDEDAGNGMTYREKVTVGLLKGAMKGNAVNYKAIIELLGEKPEDDSKVGILTELLEALNNGKKD